MLILRLALRDLLRDRFFLLCNAAVLAGVMVPLLVLFGVKNGVYQALIGQMMANPATLQIDTQGNAALSEDRIAPLRGWADVAFLTPRIRSQFDYVSLFRPDDGGTVVRQALLLPSGAGDPNLPPGAVLAAQEVALSALLAVQLRVAPGDRVDLVTQAEGRKQLRLPVTVRLILPEAVVGGRAVLAPFATLDTVEAFYDAYALPDHGITEGKPLSERVPQFEGVRLYARSLEDLAAVQQRVEATLGLATSARTREVTALLGLGRNLDLALGLTATLAALGLVAALVFGFWSDVMRKRGTLAALAMLGLPARVLALFPLVQALMTALLGLGLSFGLYAAASSMAGRLFGAGMPNDAPVTLLPPEQAAAIVAGVLALVLAAAAASAWAVLRVDPARVLREGG